MTNARPHNQEDSFQRGYHSCQCPLVSMYTVSVWTDSIDNHTKINHFNSWVNINTLKLRLRHLSDHLNLADGVFSILGPIT